MQTMNTINSKYPYSFFLNERRGKSGAKVGFHFIRYYVIGIKYVAQVMVNTVM